MPGAGAAEVDEVRAEPRREGALLDDARGDPELGALVALGLLDPSNSTYVQPALPWLSIAVGSTMFGLGMALVGTCSFGSLVRLGSGDLRSLIVMMVFGSVAYATLRGMLAPVRIEVLEKVAWPVPGGP